MSKARGLADLGNVYDDGALSNRNMIINGAMQVAQRGTSQTGASGYLLDRWKKQSLTASSATFSQDTADTPEGFRYALKVLASGSSAFIQLGQAIEFKNMAHVVGKTVTLSYRAKTNLSFDSRIRSRTDTEDAATVFSAATLSAITESASTDWKLFTHTFTVPTATLAMSVDFSAGAVVSGDYFQITGVQLEIGDTATPFEHRSIGQELALCQRYYYEINYSGAANRLGWGYSSASTQCKMHFQTPVPMRATPTFSSTNVGYRDNGDFNVGAVSSPLLNSYNGTIYKIQFTVSGATAGTAGELRTTAAGATTFDAEL